MIRNGAPPEWTALWRLVAFEIADDARPDTAMPPLAGPWPESSVPLVGEWQRGQWRDGLADVLGMSERAISRVLTDLGNSGYEMRVPISDRDGVPVRDKRGRLLFAANGHALRLRVPPLPPRQVLERSPNPAAIEYGKVAESGDQTWDGRSPNLASKPSPRSPLLATKVAESGVPLPPSHQSLSSIGQLTTPHAQLAAVVPDVTERETELVLQMLNKRPAVQSATAVLPHEIRNGNGPALVAQVRPSAATADRRPTGGSPSDVAARALCGRCGGPGHLKDRCPTLADTGTVDSDGGRAA
jgi:hypothetical protein